MRKFSSRLSTLIDPVKRDNWLVIAQQSFARAVALETLCQFCATRNAVDGICSACEADLPWRMIPWNRHLPYVDDVFACFNFAYPVRQLIHRVKYGRDIACAALLGRLAATRLAVSNNVPNDAMIFPVPQTRRRMVRRGFNHAVEIALPIALEFSLHIEVVSVYKRKSGPAQSTLNAANRRKNMQGSFDFHERLKSNTAIIVDDVITTGATASAMAHTLRLAGAKRVVVWTIAAA
ncbi:MAG: ComF family protein [Gammaproteobacteria bacterium]|jgi:ComF family protein